MHNATNAPGSKPLSSPALNLSWGEQPSPWLLNYACAINGFATRPPGKDFVYCEIGSAAGSDLLFLAAANPEGCFFGIQTDGLSLAPAEALRTTAGVGNCRFYERPSAELGSLDIPPADFLVLKGVLSREDMAARHYLLGFAAQHLKAGGVLLCSYRTPHAWAFWEPVIHFLRAAAAAPGDRQENIQQALRELQALREAGAALFQISPLMEAILDSIGAFDPLIFDQAFLQMPSRTLYFDAACSEIEGIGLGYAGSLPLATNYPQTCLPANLKERYASLPGLRLRESWKDLVRMPFFRQDLFTSAPRADRPELPTETILGSHLPRGQFQFAFDLPGAAAVRLDGPIFPGLADLLAENALALSAILSAPSLQAFPATEIIASLAWMTAMEQVRPFAAEVRAPGADPSFRLSRFNTALLQRQLCGPQGDIALASWTLGNGLALNRKEALALLALSEAGPEQAEAWAGRWLVNHALPGQGTPDEPSLGQILQQARANPRSLAALGLSEKES